MFRSSAPPRTCCPGSIGCSRSTIPGMHNPVVPETLEGWSILHLMYRVRWDRVRALSESDRRRMSEDATSALAVPDAGSTALVQVLGHKADLMVICFRTSFEQLGEAQLAFSRTALHDLLRSEERRVGKECRSRG